MTVTVTGPDPARVVTGHRARVHVRCGATARVGARSFTPAVWPTGNQDQLIIVEALTESPLCELRGAKVGKPSWVLNGMGDLDFQVSAFDDGLDYLVDQSTVRDGAGRLKLIGREVQWWRNGVLYWAGVPVTADPDLSGVVKVECHDQAYYLSRRFWGQAQRKDLLEGIGSMDVSGIPGWTRHGATTATRATVTKVRGAGSAELSGSGWIEASFTHPTTTISTGVNVWITAMVKLPPWTPVGQQIIGIQVRGVAGGAVVSSGHVEFDSDAQRESWQRFSCYAVLPPGGPHYVTAILNSGAIGSTFVDDVRVLKNDTTGLPSPGKDLTTHGLAAVDHWQGHSKGTFGFQRKVIHPTGTVEVMGVRHLEHIQATDWLHLMTSRADGFDWFIDPRTRTIYFTKHRGRDHTNIAVTNRNVGRGGWQHDESELSSDIVVLGDGDGVDRPEGGYSDRTNTAGLGLDYVHRPETGTPLSALDPMAEYVHAEKSQPQETPNGLTVSDVYLDDLQPGDTVPVDVSVGKVRLDSRVRIGTIALDVDAGQLELN